MKSLVDPVRTTWPCLSRWFLCLVIMGAISPGFSENLGFENSPTPEHWKNNSTPSILYFKFGRALQIKPNKEIRGVRDIDQERYLNFTHITSDKNTTAIRSTDTQLFLCMDTSSKLYASIRFIKMDCEWIEQLLPTYYSAYLHKHHDLKKDIAAGRPNDIPFYLGMNMDGSMRLGKESRKRNRSVNVLRRFYISSYDSNSNITPTTVTTTTTTTVRRKEPPIGCKGLKTKYCIRMRRRRKNGKSIRHAKRHRKCMPNRYNMEGETLIKDTRKLNRLRRQCLRILRKRLERKRKRNSRTSVVTNKPTHTRRRRPRPHRTSVKT